MRPRSGALGAVALVAVALTACTGGTNPSRMTAAPSTATTPSASSTATPTTPTAVRPTTLPRRSTPAPPVPVDQIPPGRPTSWIPAGVPTTARYRQPGDVAPRFTLDMFTHNHTGALAVMKYYFDALNWDAATGATPSLYGLVCPSACYQEIHNSKQLATRHEHVAGGRITTGQVVTGTPAKSHKADWAGQFKMTVTAGKLLHVDGSTAATFRRNTVALELDAKFVGRRWKIVGIYFVR